MEGKLNRAGCYSWLGFFYWARSFKKRWFLEAKIPIKEDGDD
jgi:hypothetical protein